MRLLLSCTWLFFACGAAFACSSSSPSSEKAPRGDDDSEGDDDDSEGDDNAPASGKDASTETSEACLEDEVPAGTKPDDTCAAFGEADPCDATCGRKYGYVCGKGPPPGIEHCTLARSSSIGETYCCAELACFRVPSLDPSCEEDAKPDIYQCPTEGEDKTLLVQPAAGCVEVTTSPIPEYRYFCCPSE